MQDQFSFNFRGNDYTVNVLYYSPAQAETYDEPRYDAEIEFEVYRGHHLVNANWDSDAILRMYEDELREAKVEREISQYEACMENC